MEALAINNNSAAVNNSTMQFTDTNTCADNDRKV